MQDLIGTEVDRVGPNDFHNGEYWTNEASAAARVRISDPDAAADVQVTGYALEVLRLQEQGWIGPDNSKDIGDFGTPSKARNAAAPSRACAS